MEKGSKDSWLSFSGYWNTALAKYIKNDWPHLEVTPTLRIRCIIGFPVLNWGIQVAKTSRTLGDPLQIWQSPFACSYKIILLPVRIFLYDTSLSMRRLRKRSLFAILVWKIHSTIGTSCTVRPSKNNESRSIKWTDADPQWLGGWFFWWNHKRQRVMVSSSLRVVGYIYEVARWRHSKNEKRNWCEQNNVYSFLYQ
jgi:hypothetical protein